MKRKAIRLMVGLSVIFALSGCGGGGGGAGVASTSTTASLECDSIRLTESIKDRILAGMTIQQADMIIGCKSDLISDDPVTYAWSNTATIGFGVNLDANGQVNGIFDNEDRIKCLDTVFTNLMVEQATKDLPVSQVDLIIGCEGQLKGVDFDLVEGTNSGLIQYLNNKDEEINIFFKNDLVLSAIRIR